MITVYYLEEYKPQKNSWTPGCDEGHCTHGLRTCDLLVHGTNSTADKDECPSCGGDGETRG